MLARVDLAAGRVAAAAALPLDVLNTRVAFSPRPLASAAAFREIEALTLPFGLQWGDGSDSPFLPLVAGPVHGPEPPPPPSYAPSPAALVLTEALRSGFSASL